MDAGPALYDPSQGLAAPAAPLLLATPAEPASAAEPAAPAQAPSAGPSPSPIGETLVLSPASKDEDLTEMGASSALAQMPQIPACNSTPADQSRQPSHKHQSLAQIQTTALHESPSGAQAKAASVEDEKRRQVIEEEVQSLPWVQNMSRLSQDRVRRIMLELGDAEFLFRSNMRKFFRVSNLLLSSRTAVQLFQVQSRSSSEGYFWDSAWLQRSSPLSCAAWWTHLCTDVLSASHCVTSLRKCSQSWDCSACISPC